MTTPTLPADWALPDLPSSGLRAIRIGVRVVVWRERLMREFALAAAQSAYAAGFRAGAMACAAEHRKHDNTRYDEYQHGYADAVNWCAAACERLGRSGT